MSHISFKKILLAMTFCLAFVVPGTALATIPTDGGASPTSTCPSGEAFSPSTASCDALKTSNQCQKNGINTADPTKCNSDCNSSDAQTCLKQDPIVKDLNTLVNALSAAVGLLVIGVIIVGGIQYILAGDNATATGAAKQRIINGLIALLAYIFLFGFLQWITPGGI